MTNQDARAREAQQSTRRFSAIDGDERRLRADAALTRQELGDTVTELVRRTDPKSALRGTARRAGGGAVTWMLRRRPQYLILAGTVVIAWRVLRVVRARRARTARVRAQQRAG